MNEGSGESSSGRAGDARNRADYGERAGTAYSTRNERPHFDRSQFANYDRGGYQPNRGFRGDGFHFRGQQRGFDNANQRNGPRKPFFDSKRIPDRWMNYDGVGCDMEGTRFLPFKTPLDRSFFVGKPNIHEDEHFDVDSLIRLARENGKRIGLVIDLTNTSRYYDKTDWEKHDVQYVKLNCPGHEVDGRDDIVEKFNTIVEDFVTNSENDGKLIGVHCTHGLNRTGYLICRYLIDKLNWTAAAAISAFEVARKHPIERAAYKAKLYEAEAKLGELELVDEVEGDEEEESEKSEEKSGNRDKSGKESAEAGNASEGKKEEKKYSSPNLSNKTPTHIKFDNSD